MRKLLCLARETERLCVDYTGGKVPTQILEYEGFVCVLSVLRADSEGKNAEELALKFDICVERLRDPLIEASICNVQT